MRTRILLMTRLGTKAAPRMRPMREFKMFLGHQKGEPWTKAV